MTWKATHIDTTASRDDTDSGQKPGGIFVNPGIPALDKDILDLANKARSQGRGDLADDLVNLALKAMK